jgi:ferredoxin
MFTRRNLIRLVLLLVCTLFALGFVPEKWQPLSVLLPSLSPLVNLSGALSTYTFGASTLLALPLLLLPFFKGRFFCWRLCPLGFVLEILSRLNKRNARLVRNVPFVGKGVALVILASALAGYPVLIWTDPLSLFNGFFAAWRGPLTGAAGVLAVGALLVLLLSLLAPNLWCHWLCPLGGLEELLTQLANKLRAVRKPVQSPVILAENVKVGRRVFLGFALGGAAGLAYGNLKSAAAKAASYIRPPGAAGPTFSALCSRCGNCMRACPYGLIVPDLGASGADGLFTPVLKFRSQNSAQESFCFQGCTACSQVCPSGAIRRLKIEEKQQTAIGLARIDKKACIAWEKGEFCVVCQEFCPYQAIIEINHKKVKCPSVDEEKCRGCGACESQCPSLPIAIVVQGANPQTHLTAPVPSLSPTPTE